MRYGLSLSLCLGASFLLDANHVQAQPLPGLALPTKFGYALAVADFDGDGKDDVAVGDPAMTLNNQARAGAVLVFNSRNNWGSPSTFSQANLVGAAETGDLFGAALAAGDFNGDGKPDLAVGVPGEDLELASGSIVMNVGAVNIIYNTGTSSGLGTANNVAFNQDSTDIVGGCEGGDQFGYSLATANVGMTATADLIIGVPGEDITAGTSDAGAVQVLYGVSGTGLTAANNQMLTGAQPGDQLGYAVAAAPLKIFGGAPYAKGANNTTKAGRVLVYSGTSGAKIGTTPTLQGIEMVANTTAVAGDAFGSSLAAARTSAATPQLVVLIGVPGRDVSGVTDAGAVVLSGSTNSLLTAASFSLSNQTAALFGSAVAARNVPDGDTAVEIAIGAARYDGTSNIVDSGAVVAGSVATNAVANKVSKTWASNMYDAFKLRGAAVALAADRSTTASLALVGSPRRVDMGFGGQIPYLDAEAGDNKAGSAGAINGPVPDRTAGLDYVWVESIMPDGHEPATLIDKHVEYFAEAWWNSPMLRAKGMSIHMAIQAPFLDDAQYMDDYFRVVEEVLNNQYVDVHPWLVLDFADGYFPNATNSPQFIAAGRKLISKWKARGLPPGKFIIDMEPPHELTKALGTLDLSDPATLLQQLATVLPLSQVDKTRYAAAVTAYTSFVDELHAAGWAVLFSTQATVLADYKDTDALNGTADDDLRQYLNIIVDGPRWDYMSFQLYRSAFTGLEANLDEHFVYDFSNYVQQKFAGRGAILGVDVGTTHPGPVFQDLPALPNGNELRADIEGAIASGISGSRIGVYNLHGIWLGPPVCKLSSCTPDQLVYEPNDPESWLQPPRTNPPAPAVNPATNNLWTTFSRIDSLLNVVIPRN